MKDDQRMCGTEPEPLFRLREGAFDSEVVSVWQGSVRICANGTCYQMPAKNWVRLATDGISESKHIDAMFRAVEWCFGPSDAIRLRKKYRELVFAKQEARKASELTPSGD